MTRGDVLMAAGTVVHVPNADDLLKELADTRAEIERLTKRMTAASEMLDRVIIARLTAVRRELVDATPDSYESVDSKIDYIMSVAEALREAMCERP